MKRRTMTLVELLVSMGLLSVLLVTLFSLYGQVHRIDRFFAENRAETFRMRHAQSRLWDVLSHAVGKGENGQPTPFYTSDGLGGKVQGTSLVFVRDNGPVLKAEQSNCVLSRLFLDEQGRLSLATWSMVQKGQQEAPEEMTLEVLLENVKSLEFSFFYPLSEAANVEGYEGPFQEVTRGWLQVYKKIPVTMEVRLELEKSSGEKELFVVAVPLSHHEVLVIL